MEIYKKLQSCRQAIKITKTKKKGWNDYSKYAYFLPEQIQDLVSEVCFSEKLFTKYDLSRDEHGIFATLTVVNIENTKEVVIFKMITDIPSITATNTTQQLGGAVTYSERYLKMSTFEITDDTLDFDTDREKDKKTPPKSNTKTSEKPWLNKYADKDKSKIDVNFWKIINEAKKKNMTIKDLRKYYKISEEVASDLETDLL